MFDDRIGNLQKMLARMGPEGRQKYAADHADDPIAVSMALFVNNIAKEIKEGKRSEPEMPPPVVQQAIQAMNQPKMPQGMPPQGPPQGMPPQGMPPQGMPPQRMPPPQGQTRMAADGGYMDSRLPEDMGIGALPERSLANMADGGIVGYSDGGSSKRSKQPSFNDALDAENIQDPIQRAFLKALYEQESGSGANTTTSNQGAVGHMQIKPGTFKQVADKGMDINNAFDNMRAGIRYGMQGYKVAGGNPVLAGAYYYGGPGGMEALANGEVRKDPKNPKAPNTLEYGNNIAQRMTALLPIGTAQAETSPAAAAPSTKSATTADLQALRRSDESFGNKAKTMGQVARSVVQNPLAQIASGFAGIAGSVLPGPEGQGADYVKRTQDYMGYNPELTKDSKNILGALNYPAEFLSTYAAKPVGDFLAEKVNPATGAIAQGVIAAAPAALGLGRSGKGAPTPVAAAPAAKAPAAATPAAKAPAAATAEIPVRTVPTAEQMAAAAQAVPKPATAPPPAIRTTLTSEQISAGLGAPPLVGPRKPVVVPAPKTTPVGGLATISPEAAALRAAAEAKLKARLAATVAATERKPIVVAAKADAAEAPKPAIVAAGDGAVVTKPRFPALLPASVAAGAGTGFGNESNPDSTGNLRGKSGIADIDIGPVQERPPFDRTSGDDTTHFPLITPEIAKTAVTLAQAEIPKKEQGGFSYEDLMMFGLQLMAGKSQYALQNVGEAGVATLTARQARAKAEADKRKSEAEALRDTAYSKYLQDKIDQGPEERKLAAEDRRARIENERLNKADILKRQIEADAVAKQQKVDAALQKNPDYAELIRRKTIAGFNLNKNEKQIKEYSDLLQDINDFKYKFYKSRGIDTQAEFNPSTVKFVGFE